MIAFVPDYAALAAELQSADLASLDDAAAAAKLNADTATALVPGRYLAEGGVLRVLGPTDGDAASNAIEAAAGAGDSISVRIVRIPRDQAGEGVDFGDPITHAMLDQYQAGGVLSADQVATLESYGTRTVQRTRAEATFGRAVTVPDVAQARSL